MAHGRLAALYRRATTRLEWIVRGRIPRSQN
jgi:hypothetical protein